MNKNKRLLGILVAIAFLLLLPLIAMQFSSEVVWTLSDFVIMGFLLLVTGLSVEIVLRKVQTTSSRLVAVGIVLFVFFLIWAELAVGIFGTPFAGS